MRGAHCPQRFCAARACRRPFAGLRAAQPLACRARGTSLPPMPPTARTDRLRPHRRTQIPSPGRRASSLEAPERAAARCLPAVATIARGGMRARAGVASGTNRGMVGACGQHAGMVAPALIAAWRPFSTALPSSRIRPVLRAEVRAEMSAVGSPRRLQGGSSWLGGGQVVGWARSGGGRSLAKALCQPRWPSARALGDVVLSWKILEIARDQMSGIRCFGEKSS